MHLCVASVNIFSVSSQAGVSVASVFVHPSMAYVPSFRTILCSLV